MKWTASCFYGPNLAPFCLFWSFSQRNYKYSTTVDYKWKKRRWCAWNSNLGLQDCRHRQIHWAMVKRLMFNVEIIHKVSGPGIQTRDHLIRQSAPESWNFWGYSLCIFLHLSGQSYKAPTIVIYDCRVVPDLKLPHIKTLESKLQL